MQAMAKAPPKPWPTGQAEQIEPLVRRVLAPNPSPFTYTGTQTYIVGLGDGCAVIDPGPNEPAHLAALEAAIGEEHVVATMCTHTHRDHSPASRPLARRTGAPIVGCAALAFSKIDVTKWYSALSMVTLAFIVVSLIGVFLVGRNWTILLVSFFAAIVTGWRV